MREYKKIAFCIILGDQYETHTLNRSRVRKFLISRWVLMSFCMVMDIGFGLGAS